VTVGYVYDPIFLKHDTGQHPENADRLSSIMAYLEQADLLSALVPISAPAADLEDVRRVHSDSQIQNLKLMSSYGRSMIDLETVVSRDSYQAALMAAGGTITATQAIFDQEVQSAFALVRPPGHHATPTHSMGFCLLNNLAIAAAWAINKGLAHKVAIVDFDVHHGNGIQDATEADPNILYVSTHQYPFYPGTGALPEDGIGKGKGSCLNIPLPAHTGDSGYLYAMDNIVQPALERFGPDILLVAAGYDAHWADPLAEMLLSTTAFGQITELLLESATNLCQGRILLALEGGYHPQALAHGVAASIDALRGQPYKDILGPARHAEADVREHVARVAAWHHLV